MANHNHVETCNFTDKHQRLYVCRILRQERVFCAGVHVRFVQVGLNRATLETEWLECHSKTDPHSLLQSNTGHPYHRPPQRQRRTSPRSFLVTPATDYYTWQIFP
jgi:hypothetical protein